MAGCQAGLGREVPQRRRLGAGLNVGLDRRACLCNQLDLRVLGSEGLRSAALAGPETGGFGLGGRVVEPDVGPPGQAART